MIRVGWLASILLLAPVKVLGTGEEPVPVPTTTTTATSTAKVTTTVTTTSLEHAVFKVRTSSDCYGQEVWQEPCPDLPSCNDCVPDDCEFSEWDEWRDHGDCSGLKLRKRTIAKYENECGAPCDGVMTETARTELQEQCKEVEKLCTVAEWGEWTACTTPTQQKLRTRKMSFTLDPTEDNILSSCDAETKETAPCQLPPDASDCKFGPWGTWTDCSESCGDGYQARGRVIAEEAADGGMPCNGTLRESRMCNSAACPPQDCKMSQWSAWSGCDSTSPHNKHRSRHIITPGNEAGTPCAGPTIESECCDFMKPSDCLFSEWCEWSHCTPLGGCGMTGQSFRVRRVLSEPFNGGTCPSSDLQETKPCSLPDCETNEDDCVMGDWEEWGACSAKCGKGDKTRTRAVKKEATGKGLGCEGALTELSPCDSEVECGKVDCTWNEWSDWSDCTTTCGNGTKIHTRNIKTSPRNGGTPCEAQVLREAEGCNLGECKDNCVDAVWGNWADWTACTASCGDGFKSRHRKVSIPANDCGKDVLGDSVVIEPCKGEAPCTEETDCKMQPWSDWSDCSASCFGHQYRHREVEDYARAGGRECDDDLRQVQSCHPLKGLEPPEGCTDEPKPLCTEEDWSDWSGCTKCGGGYQHRHRDIKNKPCKLADPPALPMKLLETAYCPATPCEDNPCLDCIWADWADWSACPIHGGEKTRKRYIKQNPNHCGKPCFYQSSSEVEACNNTMDEWVCRWSAWSSSSGCSRSCGPAVEREDRHLSLVKAAELEEGVDYLFKGPFHYFDTRCEGTESRLINCSKNENCPARCTPIDCVLGDWGDWHLYGNGCTGLKQRFRSIKKDKNECGLPCTGILTQTEASPDPCNKTIEATFCDWSEWDTCLTELQQKHRYRYVEGCQGQHDCPGLLDFTKLEGPLKETAPCGGGNEDRDCEFSEWHEWSCCSATCGGGRKQRHRAIVSQAQGAGTPCEGYLTEGKDCGEEPCGGDVDCKLTEWTDWEEEHCTELKGMGQRSSSRHILTASMGSGLPCNGSLVKLEACPPFVQDCEMTDWSEWTPCTRSCGGGQQKKERVPKEFPYGKGAKTCPTVVQVTQGCNTESCTADEDCKLSAWSAWSECTRSCGGGQANRSRKVLTPASGHNGLGCLGSTEQVEGCNEEPCQEDVDCIWGDWHDWSGCTKSCGSGTQRRQRRIMQFPLNQGKKCDVEDKDVIQTCNTQQCDVCKDGEWDDWDEWTSCTVTCGSGTSWRHRTIAVTANDCGAEPIGSSSEVKECKAAEECQSKDIDCKLQDWADWHGCSKVCDGYKRRVRDIAVHGQANGAYCQAEEGCKPLGGAENCTPAILEEFVHCGDNPELCGKKVEESEDCELSEWSEWSCSATCGRGQALSSRTVLKEAKGSGKPCENNLNKTAACAGLPSCGNPPQDCEYSDWGEWGVCSKCAGQRSRYREVVQQAKNGGAVCVANSTRDTMGCNHRKCNKPLFCTWEDWQDWSTCDKPCGNGKRERKRSLTLTSEETIVERMEMINSDLQQQLDAQKDANVRQVVMAFSAGAVALLLAAGAFRAFKASSSASHHRRPSFPREAAYE